MTREKLDEQNAEVDNEIDKSDKKIHLEDVDHLTICCDKFEDNHLWKPSPPGKKINLKIDKADYQLIEYLQECYPSSSKTELVTHLFLRLLKKELVKIEHLDYKVLVAKRADEKWEPSLSWSNEIFQDEVVYLQEMGMKNDRVFLNCNEESTRSSEQFIVASELFDKSSK